MRMLMEDKLYRDGLKIRLQLQRGYIKAKGERKKSEMLLHDSGFKFIWKKKGKSKKESSRSPLDEETHTGRTHIIL